MMPNFGNVKVNLFCKGAVKVSALLLIGICAFGIVPWNEAAAVCYAKTDTDKEKVEEFVTEYFEAHTAEGIETLSDYVEDAESVVEEIMAFKVSLEWVQDLSYAIDLARADGGEKLPGQENEEIADVQETYIVREGDCLWSIAEEQFGDGMYWSNIYEANCELIGDNPDLLYVGWELKMDIPIETVYTDEECKEITFGNINCNISKFYHIARVVEEENRTTFYAEADSKPDEPGFHGPQQITYTVSKEPELSDSYEEAFKYFEGITELRYFRSYQTADDNTIRALYKAMEADEDKAYYLVGVSGEDGLYFIETEDILLDSGLAVLYGRNSPFVEEYCYTLSDIKCGRNYIAQAEKNIYFGEMRAEYKVTSDLLNYTAEFSAVPSEDDESKLVNTWNVTLENEPYKVSTVQWISDAQTRLGYLDYPDFDDMNADGYLDLLGYVYTPHRSRSMKTIFVWDEQEQEYVQVIKVGGSQESEWPNTFCSPFASDDRVEEWHIKYEDMIETVHYYCYRWEGNKLLLDDEDEYTLVYDMEKDVYVREESPNPYAHLDTFSSAYLYDIYEAGKESTADGDWFIDDSERFTYYEVYDPLNDEHLSAEWEIELAEMKGTDRLAQAVNEYHAELFEEQKEWMREKQDTVMAMDVEEYRSGMNGRRDSNNIRTMVSFEWGNVFTVVDMENRFDRRCCPVIANFNRVTGEKYEFADLFNTDDYNAKLLELIRYRYDGYVNDWDMDLESESFSFMITNQGLLVINDYPPRSLLFDWIELEDILNREVCSELGIDTGWKDLGSDKVISHDFFSNANQWHYNLTDETLAAEVICAYVGDNIEEGMWELRDMHIRRTENGRILNFVACAEDGTRELYMLLDETRETGRQYLVMADVKVSKYGDVSYDSDSHWEAYQGRADFPEKYSAYSIYADRDAYVYESVYLDASINAMADYLACVQADKDTEWWLLGDSVFIDENGLLADVCFSDGFQRVHMMVDRDSRNRRYSIVEVYSAQDTKDFSAELTEQEQTKWDDLYDIEGTEANFFDNAYRFRYNPQIFKAAACAVKDYAAKIGLADEEWELTHMYSEDGAVGVVARAKSTDRRLSLLIKGNTYQVIADVQEGDSGEYDLSDGYLSYDSEMKWHSYYEWTINGEKENEFVYTVHCNDDYYRHDSIYEYQLNRAMQEYLSTINANIEEEWEMLPEKLFVGCYGSLADAWYTNGNCKVHLVVDVWNKTYAVIK